MQQSCPYGSVRGASGNRRPYRDKRALFERADLNQLFFPGLVSVVGETHVAVER
jgi:hypothetical protein